MKRKVMWRKVGLCHPSSRAWAELNNQRSLWVKYPPQLWSAAKGVRRPGNHRRGYFSFSKPSAVEAAV